MKLKYILILLVLLAFGGLVFYRISKNKEIAAQAGPPGAKGGGGGKGGPGAGGGPPMRVNGVVMQPRPFANTLSVTGNVEPNEQVQIRGEVSGRIKAISFQEGTRVSAGQTLVKIDDSELRAQLAQAQTRKNLAAENERRARLLLEKEAISREEFEVAHAELQSAQSQIQLVQAQLAKTTIKAPFAGTIGLRSVSVGGYLTPDQVVANLVSTDPVKVTFSIPEKYAGQVRTNTALTLTVAGSDEKFTATVYAIEPGIETTTRSLQLRAKAANPTGKLRPGSFANIELPLEVVPKALLVPTQAVVPIQNGKKVFVARNGKAQEAIIETSTRTESEVLVTSGLAAGDTVLTTGILNLKAGSPVMVKIAPPDTVAALKK